MPGGETSTPKAGQEPPTPGMRCLDTSSSPRVPVLMEVVGALSRAVDPQEVVGIFSSRMRDLFGTQGYISISTRGLAPGQYKITRIMDLDKPGDEATLDPWREWDQLPVHSGGFFGELIRKAFPELIHHLQIPNDPVVGDALAGYGSLMAIPLFDNGEPLNWAIFLRRDPQGFTSDELEDAILRSNLVGATVKNAVIARELREAHARIRGEMERIAGIQRALLPDPLPQIPGLNVDASFKTFDQAGGDHFDFLPMRRSTDEALLRGDAYDPNGPWGLLIADASGHGPAAAVVVAMMHAIMGAYPREPAGPGEVLEHANRHLVAKRIESSFVTAFLGIYDPQKRTLSYARAGHNPPLLMLDGGGSRVQRLDQAGSVPLGIMEEASYDHATVQLERGQTLVLYTDGVTEAKSPRGESFGIEGIEASLAECTGEPSCVIEHVTEALLSHQSGQRPADDQTIVAVRVEG